MHLLSISDLTDLLNKAGIAEYKIFKNNLGGFTLDFVVIFKSSDSIKQCEDDAQVKQS